MTWFRGSRRRNRRSDTIRLHFSDDKIADTKTRWESDIRAILSAVPPADLVGLGGIVVLASVRRGNREAQGKYCPATPRRDAEIQITSGVMNVPAPFNLLAIARRACIAHVLLHEVGHHVQTRRHGITKREIEFDADSYAKRMSRNLFPRRLGVAGFILFIIAFIMWIYPRRVIRRFLKPGASQS
jgi:hypothetical protein